jgi:hypothetical protein
MWKRAPWVKAKKQKWPRFRRARKRMLTVELADADLDVGHLRETNRKLDQLARAIATIGSLEADARQE